MSITAPVSTPRDSDRLRAHREARRRHATSARGPASFYWGDFVTEPETVVDGAPGRWAPLPSGVPGLRVRASAADGIRIGERLIDGEGVLFAREEDGPTVARFGDGAEGVIFSYDDTKYALQVWNPHSPWASRFHDIDAFPEDPSWRVSARIAPTQPDRTVTITHHRDPRPVEVPVVAEVVFTRDGVRHRLLATSGGPGQSGLFVHFRDLTNGLETYGAGRGLRFQPDGDRAELDFNYAELLPCSFSLAWNCPLPAAENTLPIVVRAGERNAVDVRGEALL